MTFYLHLSHENHTQDYRRKLAQKLQKNGATTSISLSSSHTIVVIDDDLLTLQSTVATKEPESQATTGVQDNTSGLISSSVSAYTA